MKPTYLQKDKLKFLICNKLITRGVYGSSSFNYMKEDSGLGFKQNQINTHDYSEVDIVGVSVNGMRRNRKEFDKEEVNLAIDAGVTFVCDSLKDSSRPYNIGEREFKDYLLANGYKRWENECNDKREVFIPIKKSTKFKGDS